MEVFPHFLKIVKTAAAGFAIFNLLGRCPNPLKDEIMELGVMANRQRDVELKLFLSQEENELLAKKMVQVGTNNKSAYVRKMILDGMIVKTDFKVLKELSNEINKIGVNINQITKQLNEMQNISGEDISNIKNMLQAINKRQKETLSFFINELQ